MDTCEPLSQPTAPLPIVDAVQPTANEPIVRDYALTGSQIVSTVGPQKKTRFVLPANSKDAVDSEHTGQSNNRKTHSSKHKSAKKRKWRHMVLGYMVPKDIAAERAAAMWGRTDNETITSLALGYVMWAIQHSGLMFSGRVNLRVVWVDKKNKDIQFCIALAENTSAADMVLPRQETIDKLKELLQTEETPKWWKLFG